MFRQRGKRLAFSHLNLTLIQPKVGIQKQIFSIATCWVIGLNFKTGRWKSWPRINQHLFLGILMLQDRKNGLSFDRLKLEMIIIFLKIHLWEESSEQQQMRLTEEAQQYGVKCESKKILWRNVAFGIISFFFLQIFDFF